MDASLPKILIIDDEPAIRETLEGLLSVEDVDLLFAGDGVSGLELARQFQPDAILLDVMMPGIDGYETCRRIRATPTLAEVPIIMITALDDRDSRLTGLRAGVDDFLTKPFDGLELQIRIKNIMRLNRYRNLVAERSRFFWVVEDDEKGYLILNQKGEVQYANQRAQGYFHLPEQYTGIDFARQVERYYQPHQPEEDQTDRPTGNVTYLVQPETATARAFWLRLEMLNETLAIEGQRLARVSDVTSEMSNHHDIRKIQRMVAHKLRTPVSHIFTSMDLFKAGAIPDEELRDYVKIAWQGAERLVNEVENILKYIEAPLALANGTPVSIAELGQMVMAAGEILQLKDISISIPDQLTKKTLSISANAMDLIVHEILENSQKFHPTQTPQIQIRTEAHSEHSIQIQFLDDGRTMTAGQINRAMLPYTQSEKWFTGGMAGMGLGLPLVATLVWQVGGQIRVTNRADQVGICISLVLPELQ